MLKKIKSTFFVKLLFTFLHEKIKLKMVKYNKNMQKQIDISIINYKLFTGNFIIYESKGQGEEYNYINELIYVGEYKNGERNGKGKEYDYEELIYEGEYLNGKRNGKGIEYNLSDTPIFKGEYLNGKKWNGRGFFISNNNKNKIEYEIRNGKGFCQERFIYDQLLFFAYEGEYKNGERNGKGKEYDDDEELIFEGEYLNGKRWNGRGYDENGNIIYELKDGNGFVKEFNLLFPFEGEYSNGEKNGKGKYYSSKGKIKSEGEYINGERNGKGKEFNSVNGSLKFEGEYLNGKRWNGRGKEYKSGKLIFEGEYFNGVKKSSI